MSEEDKKQCACVHHDARECARIRDREHASNRRCECVCHKEHEEDEKFWEEEI